MCCLQEGKIMKVNFHKPDIAVQQRTPNLDWSNKFYYTSSQQEFEPDKWVQLLQLPSSFSFDEALLICQLSKDEWLAWIPEHGEAVLHTRQFCALS